MKKIFGKLSWLAFLALTANMVGCASNLLPQSLESGISQDSRQKAYALLEETMKAQGYDNYEMHKSYEMETINISKSWIASATKIWSEDSAQLKYSISVAENNGKVEYREGEDKGFGAAFVDNQYYEKAINANHYTPADRNKAFIFGIEATKFLGEVAKGVKAAEFVAYAGEEEVNGQKYDVVFGTWESVEPNDDFDQYVLYINKDTKLIDRVKLTIRKPYFWAPGQKAGYASAIFEDYRDVDGFKLPFKQTVFNFDFKEDVEENYDGRLIVENFRFVDHDVRNDVKSLMQK